MFFRAPPVIPAATNPDFPPNPSKTMDPASDSNSSNGTHPGAFGVGLWCSKQTYTSIGSLLMWDCICIEPPCTHSCVRLAAAAEIDRFWARWQAGQNTGPHVHDLDPPPRALGGFWESKHDFDSQSYLFYIVFNGQTHIDHNQFPQKLCYY